jgi:hypothetical protein
LYETPSFSAISVMVKPVTVIDLFSAKKMSFLTKFYLTILSYYTTI